MKVSVSLPEDDVAYLDESVKKRKFGSRSAALHRAVSVLRAVEHGAAYEDAWRDWFTSNDSDLWEPTSSDGLKR